MDSNVFDLLDAANRILLARGLGWVPDKSELTIMVTVSVRMGQFADELLNHLMMERENEAAASKHIDG